MCLRREKKAERPKKAFREAHSGLVQCARKQGKSGGRETSCL